MENIKQTYLNIKEVSNLLDCSESTVRRLVRRGKLPYMQMSKNSNIKILSQDVIDFIVENSKY